MHTKKVVHCRECHVKGKPKDKIKGSFAIELLLYICLIIPGLIYSAWRSSNPVSVCRECKSENIELAKRGL